MEIFLCFIYLCVSVSHINVLYWLGALNEKKCDKAYQKDKNCLVVPMIYYIVGNFRGVQFSWFSQLIA